MKILELRFKNLNSLYGEWFIDFTDPEYVSNGIFALTGPTGAGKSTILDAICLALYGATPRLGRITKTSNEIMSRQTGECYAEVVFESQAGRFLCHWEQRRARKKPGGNLQNPRHDIAQGKSGGKVIESHLRRVQQAVEEKTGMDFDRFTRSILLAQGGFDTFLKADVEQKSMILEQITGTEIYSQISRRVHERRRDEQEKLGILQAETAGILLLEPEEENKIRQDLLTGQEQEAQTAVGAAEIGKAMTWLTGMDVLKKEIRELSEESTRLQGEMAAFQPERERLARALKAATLDGQYATLSAVRKQQVEDETALNREDKKLPALELSLKNQTESLTAAQQHTGKAKEDLKKAAPLIKEVRALDQRLGLQKNTVAESEADCRKEAVKIDSHLQTRLSEQKKSTGARKKLSFVLTYLKDNSRDEWLISGLAGVEEQIRVLLAVQQEIAQNESDKKMAEMALGKATQQQARYTKQCAARKQEVEETKEKHRQAMDGLKNLLGDRVLREYRTEKETLLREMALLDRIAKLEEHREKLEDGAPCPLCGAMEHPFARGNVPRPDATEKKIKDLTRLIQKAEKQKDAIRSLEKAEIKAGNNLTASEKREAAAAGDKKAAEKVLSDVTGNLEKKRSEFANLKQDISIKLKPLGIETIPDDDISSLLSSLKDRLTEWQVAVKKKTAMEKQISDIDSELKRLDAVIETQKTTLAEKQQHLETLKKAYATGLDHRHKLYGDKKPDQEEKRLNRAVTHAEKGEKQARTHYDELQRQWTSTNTTIDSLKKQIADRAKALNNLVAEFGTALQTAGFSDETQFVDAGLSPEKRDALAARAKKLDDNHTDLRARHKDREARLSTEIARKITDQPLEILEPRFRELEEKLKQLRDTIAGLKHRLTENTAARRRIKEKQAAIDVQKNELSRWEKLHGLIGSADGKKYRNFAQGLTFELMVSHANRQLKKMTDRYLLIRDGMQPLELNVIDNYQAGEIRSTRNLSGGESFIVSLTLALGLSRMASRRVRVDSLFLDEGFGTLDEEALETALETLSGLQQDAKLIGIISHVSALKERISTQITITPGFGGRSTLAGPGCS